MLGNLVTMERFTGVQRAFCRLFRVEFGLHDVNQCPSKSVIRSWVRKFETTGSTLNQKPAGRPRLIGTEETINEVRTSVQRDSGLTTRKRSAELGVSRTSLCRILTKDFYADP